MARDNLICLVCSNIQKLFIIIGCTLCAASAAAQSTDAFRVFPDQYVVEIQSVGADGASEQNPNLGEVAKRDLGSSTSLLSFSAIAGDGNSNIAAVPYLAAQDRCRDLILNPRVKNCSPNYEVKISALPNDPQLSSLWGMTADRGIDAPGAWDVSTGSSSVVVAVIDTGADYNHPDLADNIWVNTAEIAGNGIDDDGNGYIDDIHGISAVNHSGNPMDDNEHGTHVSGTIGGLGNNNRGVVGVNWNVRIMPLKFLSANGSGGLAGAIEAINYMVMMKSRGVNIRVANNSWGGGGFSQALFDAIKRARDVGIIFAAAAGNESNDNDSQPSYPASYALENVVSVAAVDANKNIASFSNYGSSQVDIAAPGVSILSTIPGNSYQSLSGTSMATPHVTGALALLAASEPSLSYIDLINRMYDSGSPVSTLSGLVRTGRMLNVSRMLHNQTEPVPAPTPVPAPCNYETSAIDFNPDHSVDAQPIVLQADEFSYYTFSLPFIFPFHNQSVSSLVISPNGVVYTKSAPGSMDYENGARAPLNSIAALQTDLYADADPDGIRVFASSDHATIQWRAKQYDKKGEGDIVVWLTVYPDGRIEQSASFGSKVLANYIARRATVGLNGSSNDGAFTYAYNSPLIKNEMGVRFAPRCDLLATVSKIKMRPKENSTRTSREILPGKRLKVSVSGYGTGTVELQPAFDGQACGSSVLVSLNNGVASFSAALSKSSDRFSRFTLTSGSVKGVILIRAKSLARGKARNARRHKSRASAIAIQNYCSAFLRTVR